MARALSHKLVVVVTGSRAEFGLLRPVMHAVARHRSLKLAVVAGGAHLLPQARTIREVEREFDIAAAVPMQRPGRTGRAADAAAFGRGVSGFAAAFAKISPAWVVVLGDRIEAFAAASAASIGGIAVCHIHGGDRAEGIADEAMRHAITKLSHLHCAATEQSAARIIKMGEPPENVRVTGSPAVDGLRSLAPLDAVEFAELGCPRAIVLMHPSGRSSRDRTFMRAIFNGLAANAIEPALVLAPNADPGSDVIREQVRTRIAQRRSTSVLFREHLPRETFLRWMLVNRHDHFLIGNSSAGLIECAALGCKAINLGERQNGRERAGNVIDVPEPDALAVASAIERAVGRTRWVKQGHPYGDGRAGTRIATLLARIDPHDPALLRKRNSY